MSKFSKDQIEIMRKAYGTLKTMNPSSPTYKKFIKFLGKLPKDQLKQLANAKIKFVSILAKNRIKGESVNETMSKAEIKKARDEFKKTGELPPHLKKLVKGKKEFEKKFKVTNVVIPGMEWMSKLGEEIEET
tara:strand:+ start:117 stop:512 length:396 start_codon:yes stop_codon:yes gene_type:complete